MKLHAAYIVTGPKHQATSLSRPKTTDGLNLTAEVNHSFLLCISIPRQIHLISVA